MRAIHYCFILVGLAAFCGLPGCVVHDGKPEAEPIWWPTFMIRESTEPATFDYTSPGPGDQPVGGEAGARRNGPAAPDAPVSVAGVP